MRKAKRRDATRGSLEETERAERRELGKKGGREKRKEAGRVEPRFKIDKKKKWDRCPRRSIIQGRTGEERAPGVIVSWVGRDTRKELRAEEFPADAGLS